MPEISVENLDEQLPHDIHDTYDEATYKEYEKTWHHICYGFLQKWKFQEDGTTSIRGYMKLLETKEYICAVEDEDNDFLRQMELEGKNLKLPHFYIDCMKKFFNDTMNKNDDQSLVPQEDLLNHKFLIPAKLELQLSFKETLEGLRQEWFDPTTSQVSNGKPCEEELDLKRLTMERVGEDHQWPNPYLQNIPQVYQEV
ncbi:hypothetical protein R1flu_019828 [Riccia fluitans]|uniref:Uncharacterized protein n=1 Tax=Riccia fluitans TaxID=41844 RepID=A0ABD1ZK40_9MARC